MSRPPQPQFLNSVEQVDAGPRSAPRELSSKFHDFGAHVSGLNLFSLVDDLARHIDGLVEIVCEEHGCREDRLALSEGPHMAGTAMRHRVPRERIRFLDLAQIAPRPRGVSGQSAPVEVQPAREVGGITDVPIEGALGDDERLCSAGRVPACGLCACLHG